MPDQSQPSEPSLPEGWVEKRDGYGRTYYADRNTCRTTWDHPLKQQHNKDSSVDAAAIAQAKKNPALLVAEAYDIKNVVEYTGETNEEGLPDGKGLMVYTGGTRHEGIFVNGKCEGAGVQFFATKCHFSGNFKDNQKNGFGVYTFANGNKFEGNFKDDQRHGDGVYIYASGATFHGEWNMGERVPGTGRYQLPGEPEAVSIDDAMPAATTAVS